MAFNILSKLLDIQILKVKGDEDNEWGRYSADGFAFADEKSFNEYINEKMLEIIRSNSYHDTEYNDVLNILRLCLNGTPLKDIIETQFKDMREKEGRKEVYRYYVDGKITQVTSNGKKLLKFANAMGKAYGNPDVDPFKSVNVIDKEMIMSTREITPEMKFQLV
jgi:hypothetical protein